MSGTGVTHWDRIGVRSCRLTAFNFVDSDAQRKTGASVDLPGFIRGIYRADGAQTQWPEACGKFLGRSWGSGKVR